MVFTLTSSNLFSPLFKTVTKLIGTSFFFLYLASSLFPSSCLVSISSTLLRHCFLHLIQIEKTFDPPISFTGKRSIISSTTHPRPHQKTLCRLAPTLFRRSAILRQHYATSQSPLMTEGKMIQQMIDVDGRRTRLMCR